jgi:hypothetical protein
MSFGSKSRGSSTDRPVAAYLLQAPVFEMLGEYAKPAAMLTASVSF